MSETRLTMRNRVQAIVGMAISTTVNQGLLDGCRRLQEMHNFRFMEASTTVTVATDDTTFALPSDFKEELNPEMSDSEAYGYRRAKKLLKNQIEARDTTDVGRPLQYRIWNGVGVFDIKSDDGYSFPIEYYKYFPDMDSDDAPTDTDFQDFLDKCHEAIEFYALAVAYRRLNNPTMADYYQSENPPGKFERKAFALILEDEKMELANADLIMEYPG